MAIREQKGRQRPFFVYWINPFTGKRESKSCETKEEAEKLDAFVKYQLKYERESFRREDIENIPQAHTLETLLYEYLKDRNLAQQNLTNTLYLLKFILENYGDIELSEINADLLKEMQDRISRSVVQKANSVRVVANSTVRRKMGIIQAALQWAYKHGYLEKVPPFPDPPHVKYARNIPPTQEEIAILYRVSPEHLKRALILGFYFGMRIGESELLKITWNDVDLNECVIRIPNANKGADDPWREAPIRQDLIPLLEQWRQKDEECGLLHLITYNGKPIRSFRNAWKAALQRAGITRHIRPYDLRHGFATEAIAAGVDYGTVAALMGHKSPVMVLEHYQHVKNKQKIDAVESMPDVAKCVQIDVCKK